MYSLSSLRQLRLCLLDPIFQVPHASLAEAFPFVLRQGTAVPISPFDFPACRHEGRFVSVP
jgi:hypothetical protein